MGETVRRARTEAQQKEEEDQESVLSQKLGIKEVQKGNSGSMCPMFPSAKDNDRDILGQEPDFKGFGSAWLMTMQRQTMKNSNEQFSSKEKTKMARILVSMGAKLMNVVLFVHCIAMASIS